ncbi:dTDP-4-amino-4,6-dideoxyglucose formyltransferase [Shewanella algae]|uniref:dTDP-4-amino-4,6-dideoxyglucose formyltransferase n=1 Tax=Shewanella algae TaxID=38313 RepID=UPI0030C7E79E
MESNTAQFQGVNFDYCYSAINKNPASLSALGLRSINVKSEIVVKEIVERYSLVISAHCKQIFPPNLVNNVRCVNIHPGLNPHNRGWFPQVFSIINKKPIGCTIHEMNEEIDHGNIIYQKEVNVYPDDSSLTVYDRVQDAEKELLENHLYDIVHGKYVSTPMLFEGNYNGIDDFKELCKLELDSVGSMGEHIDLLRALSHGNFENAYFLDDSGNKIFVRLELKTRP